MEWESGKLSEFENLAEFWENFGRIFRLLTITFLVLYSDDDDWGDSPAASAPAPAPKPAPKPALKPAPAPAPTSVKP